MYQSQGARFLFLLLPLFLFCAPGSNGTIFTVINANDSGGGSLRQAILDANAAAGTDTIEFHIAGAAPFTISPASTLPSVNDPVVIDATTQAGFIDHPVVELNGISAGTGTRGLLILAGYSTVRGLAIDRFSGDGIRIEGNGTNIIEGNFLGVGLSGNSDSGNGEGGVTIYRSRGNLIGGTTPASRNIISGGNLAGIYIIDPPSTGNRVLGNFIGTDFTGTIDRGNIQDGIVIWEASQNTIGGLTAGARNVISGNNESGIYLAGLGATDNQVVGNFIGTTFQGASPLGNGENGVTIYRGSANRIGTASDEGRNLISANSQRGIFINGLGASRNVIQGNFIGTDISGTLKLGNTFTGVGISGSPSNAIGGIQVEARNLVSGNKQSGVAIDGSLSTANWVQGNFIGTDVTGSQALGNLWNGVLLSAAPSNHVGGVVAGSGNVISGNSQRGIFIVDAGGNGNQVQGNLIGTDSTGHSDLGNAFAGVWIETAENLVGGKSTAARNVISGNDQSGIYICGNLASNNLVQANFIGTDSAGASAIGNSFGGVQVSNAAFNVIGGSAPGTGNLISGNLNSGIYFQAAASRQNLVQGNFIGTDVSGTFAIPNTLGGVYFYGSPGNTVGGDFSGAGNLISGNLRVGISLGDPGCNGNIVQGNSIGTKANKVSPLANQWHGIEIANTSSNNVIGGVPQSEKGNTIAFAQTLLYAGVRVRDGCLHNLIRGNSIFSNNGLGIDLGVNGPSLNDLGDGDSGANDLQNFPLIIAASGRYITTVQGTLNSVANKTYTVDFYASGTNDVSGYGEGGLWLGAADVTSSSSGNANFTAKFTNTIPVGRFITATATDPANNTSEFSWAVPANLPVTDSDGDGMPDEFEIAAHLNPNSNQDASLDSDGDGSTNLAEYKAGTDPLDAASVLRLLPLVKSANGVQLRFETAAEKTYGVEFTTNFVTWAFLPNAANIAGDKTVVQINDSEATNSPARFYRVHLLP